MKLLKRETVVGAFCIKCHQGHHVSPPLYVAAYNERRPFGFPGIHHPEHLLWFCSNCRYAVASECAE